MHDLTIIGAGLSGLALGYFAKKNGYSVKIYESSPRTGGRILKVTTDYGPIDLGAEFIASYHHSILALCAKFEIELIRNTINADFTLPEKMFYQSEFMSPARIKALESEFTGIISDLISLAGKGPGFNPLSRNNRDYDNISVAKWLESKNVTHELRTFFSDLDIRRQSMAGLLSLVAGSGGQGLFLESEAYYMADGSDALINSLSDFLKEDIVYQTPVTGIDSSSGHCDVAYRGSDGKTLTLRSKLAVIATSAACIPNININNIDFSLLPMPLMSFNRTISISFDEAILPDNIYVITDQSNRIIYTKHYKSKQVKQVKVHICPHLNTDPKFDVIDSTLKICNIPNKKRKKIMDVNWANCQWSGGSYPFYQVGHFQSGKSIQSISIPHIMFTGDYLVPGYAGFMEGAVRRSEIIFEQVIEILND